MHDRGAAYVDLHKRENTIVGDDSRPYLIDFQIGLRLLSVWSLTVVLRILQRSDLYHLAKHRLYCRPDLCDESVFAIVENRPWWIRMHRLFAVPFRGARRWLLFLLGVRSRLGNGERGFMPEQAFRK